MIKKAANKVSEDSEIAARKAMLREIFYDIHRPRRDIYWTNFTRGIFFGFGSVIGGTVLIALTIWGLTFLVDIPGGVGDFISIIIDTVQQSETP